MPFDLPGTVELDETTRLGKFQFEGSLMDRASSTLTLEDVGISMSLQPVADPRHMVDTAVQCTPGNSSVTHYSPLSSPRLLTKAEHSKRIHSVNALAVLQSSDRSQSLPSTPDKKRRNRTFFSGGGQSPTFLLENSQGGSSRDERSGNGRSNSRLSDDHQLDDVSLLLAVF